MINLADTLNTDKFLSFLKTKNIGKRNAFFASIGSTNTYLKKNAPVLDNGFLAVTTCQLGGRGRLGKSFESPEGGLYMSVLIKDLHGEGIASATVKTAIAVSRAIEEYMGIADETLGIKWVNDILYKGEKLCGILCELVRTDGNDHLVIGIGINVQSVKTRLTPGVADIACSIEEMHEDLLTDGKVCRVPDDYVREELCAMILAKLESHLYKDMSLCIDTYRERSVVVGKDVNVIRGGESIPAHVYGITDEANLCVQYADGHFEMLSTGEISIKLK